MSDLERSESIDLRTRKYDFTVNVVHRFYVKNHLFDVASRSCLSSRANLSTALFVKWKAMSVIAISCITEEWLLLVRTRIFPRKFFRTFLDSIFFSNILYLIKFLKNIHFYHLQLYVKNNLSILSICKSGFPLRNKHQQVFKSQNVTYILPFTSFSLSFSLSLFLLLITLLM